jgi:ectoine hydroxylase-related dioxygenase (phytanoyl-CoA dioxygenase family)
MSPAGPPTDLDAPYDLDPRQVQSYRENGYLRLRGVLSPATIARYREAITGVVHQRSASRPPLAERNVYDRAFLQVTNVWRASEPVKEFVMGKRLARIAARVMGCRGVRLWHDQALYKEPGGGFTPWHADQYYWPLASDRSITAWLPLQDTPLEMGPLSFAVGSFRLSAGRDLAIGNDSERALWATFRDYPIDESTYALGDVSFHAGWTFHRAGPNTTDRPREVMTIIYIDVDMRLAEPENANQRIDWLAWCPDVQVGEVIDSPLTPVIYQEP